MIIDNIERFIKGWFVGNFSPTLFHTDEFEIAYKSYNKGEYEKEHYHSDAIEITLIVDGKCTMNGIEYVRNNIIYLHEGDKTDFVALTDLSTVVIKIKSSINDKHLKYKFISHRGNINGKMLDEENLPNKILDVLKKYDCEIDLRMCNNKLYLGHDYAQYEINDKFLINNSSKLWVHCKDFDSLLYCSKFNELNYFFHNNDDYVLTSKKFIWAYPNKEISKKCIAVLPEISNYSNDCLNSAYGLCSDYVDNYYNELI